MDSSVAARRSHAIGVVAPVVSPAELYEVIVAACSQNYSQIQASGQRLKQMLEMFGTFDALQDIAARPNTPLPIRLQAIIQFKNTVVNHWRSRKLLSDEHRVRIRQRCLYFLDEEDETIAVCNEVVVSKLARSDYPDSWPNLINTLVETIDTILQKRYVSMVEDAGETLKLRRSLKLLNGILKEFASIKLPNGIKVMAQIVKQLRVLLYGYYSKMSMTFSPSNVTPQNFSSESVHDNILLSHLVFKCLVKMTVWLWNKINRFSADEHQQNQASVEEMFQDSAAQIKALIAMRQTIVLSVLQSDLAENNQNLRRTITVLTRHIRLFGKFFRRMQQLSHERFVLLPTSEDLIMFYWSQVVESTNYPGSFVAGTSAMLHVDITLPGIMMLLGLLRLSDSDTAAYPIRFLVQGVILFKESISQWTLVKRNGMPNKNVLSRDFVENAVRLLITRFMSLNPSDLENWMADPEEWLNLEDRENDQWEYEIRACAERLLVQICNQYSEFVVPLLLLMFNEIAPQTSIDLASVVHKEALYCAMGRCATRMKAVIPFNEWLEHRLASEARDTNPNYPIIKRRIAWLIGKWVSESCTTADNPKIWEVLVHLLQDRGPGTDAVVRLTAAAALRECVDSVDFDANIFAPFLTNAITGLISLLSDADTLESKRKVDESLNTVIEQSGRLILPFMAVITEPVPRLWVAAENDLVFKASLLVTVTNLVQAVKEHSSSLGGLVVPLIRESLAPEVIVHLDADGLTLWLNALRNAVTIATVNGDPALQDIFPQALALLSTNLDLLGSITRIIESYFLLDASHILKAHAIDLFQAFLTTLQSEVAIVNARELLQSLNILVQLSPSGLWGEAMHSSGLFSHLLKTAIAGEGDTILLTEHIYLFSRIVLSDRQMFIQLLSASAPVLGQTETFVYECLLDQWWGKFDNMSEPRHRKLTAMGIASLVSTARPEVLQRLPGEIFNLWLDVFGELREAEDQAALRTEDDFALASPDSLIRFWELDKPPDAYFRDSEGTPEYDRRQAVYNQDPIRVTQLVNFIGDRLREAELVCGSAKFQEYLNRTDPTILNQIQAALMRG